MSGHELTLADLEIRASSHTPFFGIYLATHAISDGLCMCHASVGCKVKTELHLCEHDGVADAHNRRRYSQFIDEDLIQGSTEQLEAEIVAWQRRQNSQVVVIDGSTPISLQGQSMKPVIRRMEEATGVKVVHVDARNYEQDLWQGYSATMATLLREVPWSEEPAADEVALVGYPFDRYEPDHRATVHELRRLLWGLGLKAKAVWFAGEPFSTLMETANASRVLLLPWAQKDVKRTLRKAPRPVTKLGLPAGLAGTTQWLRQVGQACDIPEERVERVIQAEVERAKPLLEMARRRLRGRRFAAFGEVPRLAATVASLMEAGMTPTVVGISPGSLGDERRLRETLSRDHGVDLPDHVRCLYDPTPAELSALGRQRALGPAPRPGPGEKADLRHAEIALGPTVEREQIAADDLPWVECGFPSERQHAFTATPWLGLDGALGLYQRVAVALDLFTRPR